MLDFSGVKGIVIPEGEVVKIEVSGTILWKKEAKNWVPYSTTTDGKTIFNGGLGYKNNTRLNSSAAEVALNGYVVIGYIPVKPGDIIRVKGIMWDSSTQTGGYFWTFDSGFTKQKQQRPNGGSQDITVTSEGNGVMAFKIAAYSSTAAYIRFSAYGKGEDLIVTVNEEIK